MRKAVIAGMIMGSFIGGMVMSRPFTGAEAAGSETYRQLNLFGDVFERVRDDYVDEVSDPDIIEAAINGMLQSLDPHSSYMTPKSFRDMQIETRGEFGGLGIEVTMESGVVKVVTPIDDTPAMRAGLRAGDLITHLDGEPVLGLTLSEAVEKMRGRIESAITVTILREGESPFDVTLVRDLIRIASVRHRTEGNIGYVRITRFNEKTESGLIEAIKEIKSELGDGLGGYVIDLRNNPGGLLDQAIAVSDAFLNQGEIVSTRGRDPRDISRDNARDGDLLEGYPIVVLINGGSASASEIVAGALQDHRRAVIMGMRSFGKGSVQTIIPLGAQGALRLTTARYFTPSGRSIQARGIWPDIEVAARPKSEIEDAENTLAATRRGEAALRNHLESGDGWEAEPRRSDGVIYPDPAPEVAEGEDAPEPEDFQLNYALALLEGLDPNKPAQAAVAQAATAANAADGAAE